MPVQNLPLPPATRASQNNVAGISGVDGVTIVNPALNQYENCLRCHGTSIGKAEDPLAGYLPRWAVAAADPLNVILQFSASASSSHPVTHDRTSGLPQPSLRANMLDLDGATYGRSMGTRILCTDYHNSDDNREFGERGGGPSRIGREQDADAAAMKALAIFPDSGYVHFLRGRLLQQTDRPQAEREFRTATRVEPNLVAPWSALAGFYEAAGEWIRGFHAPAHGDDPVCLGLARGDRAVMTAQTQQAGTSGSGLRQADLG